MPEAESIQIPASERLRYRLVTEADHQILWQLDQDPDVMKYITQGEVTSKERMQTYFLPRLRAYRNPQHGWGLWACESVNTSEFIGWILVRPMGFFEGEPDERNLEIGWRFRQSSWGQGFATEAARAVMSELMLQNKCDFLTALAIEENTASINVMKKLGMKFERAEDHDDEYGKYTAIHYSMSVADAKTD